MAWISLGKLVLLLTAFLVPWLARATPTSGSPWHQSLTLKVSLFLVLYWTLSLWWTEVPPGQSLHALGKHVKLIEVALLMVLIRDPLQARWTLGWFLLGQGILVLQGWFLFIGVPLPWAVSAYDSREILKYSVHSSYLDQTLLYAVTAVIAWHLRHRWPRFTSACIVLAIAALVHNLFLQQGRTGWIVSLTVLAMALWTDLPRRRRQMTLVMVLAVTLAIAVIAHQSVVERVQVTFQEAQTYTQTGDAATSVGFRLHAWRLSLQALAERPAMGHGVGGWTHAVRRIEGERADAVFGTSDSNPHQEYLLWAVSLGLAGPLLLLIWLSAMLWDAQHASHDLRAALRGIVVSLALAMLFNSTLYNALIGDFFVVTLGIVAAWAWREPATNKEAERV